MKLKSIKQANIKDKQVLVRVDYNVSLDENGNIADQTRISQTIDTINYLTENNARVILMSHLGRPDGKIDKRFSFENILKNISKILNKDVMLIDNFWNNDAVKKARQTRPGAISLLENTRFHPGETTNDPKLAKHLANMADIFVNDAFGSSHRAHASTVGIASFLPSYAGLLLAKEIALITQSLSNKNKKLCVIIGGAKTPEKIGVINNLLDKSRSILLGGAVANTFLSTWGMPTGVSMVDYEMIEMARQTIWKATQSNTSLLLPDDVVVSNSSRTRSPKTILNTDIPGHLAVYDIGPKSILKYKKIIQSSDNTIWNGPMGLFEDPLYAKGTNEILKAMVKQNGTTIIGGGDTLTAIRDKSILNNISHISTGGGALLEFLEKETLPGIEIVKL